MRVRTYIFGVTAALGATTLGFAGCGGTVSQNNAGSTTGTSTGGATSTGVTVTASVSSTATSTTSTSTTSSSSSSGTGGDAACNQACAHVASCNLGVTCAQLPAQYNCQTVGTQYDCLFNCVNNTACADLGFATLQACQAQCADGGVGPTDGGPIPDGSAGDAGAAACDTCVPTNCAASIGACAQAPDGGTTCAQWLTCTEACINATPPVVSCFDTCDTMYASASALYTPVWNCACTSCATECAAVNPCDHGMDGGP